MIRLPFSTSVPMPVAVSTPPKPDAAGADALDQRALRHEFDLDLAGDHFGLGFGIEADVRGDEPGDRAGADQLADPSPGPSGVVGDDGQVLRAATHERVDEAMGRTGAHEAADQQPRAVGYQRRGGVGGYRAFMLSRSLSPRRDADRRRRKERAVA